MKRAFFEMKRVLGAAGLLLWLAAFSYAGDEQIRTFRGEIADNQGGR
jgi:hypothetical protein